jgi:hypothetical protein
VTGREGDRGLGGDLCDNCKKFDVPLQGVGPINSDHVGFVQETSAAIAHLDVSAQGGSPAGGDVAQGKTLLR